MIVIKLDYGAVFEFYFLVSLDPEVQAVETRNDRHLTVARIPEEPIRSIIDDCSDWWVVTDLFSVYAPSIWQYGLVSLPDYWIKRFAAVPAWEDECDRASHYALHPKEWVLTDGCCIQVRRYGPRDAS